MEIKKIIKDIPYMVNSFKTVSNPQYGNLTIIEFENTPERWFIAKEICNSLGYITKSIGIVIKHNLYERDYALLKHKNLKNEKNRFSFSNRGILIINQNGLNNLILRSNRPNALKYKEWITREVIISIQETGSYIGSKEDAALRFSKVFVDGVNEQNLDLNTVTLDENGNQVFDIQTQIRILNLSFYMIFGVTVNQLYPSSIYTVPDKDTIKQLLISHGTEKAIYYYEKIMIYILEYLKDGGSIDILENIYYSGYYIPAIKFAIPYGEEFQKIISKHQPSSVKYVNVDAKLDDNK